MEYGKTGKTILGNRAVRAIYQSGDPDIILFGRYGAIWEYDDDHIAVLCDNPIVGNRIFKLSGEAKMKTGDEVMRLVGRGDAKRFLKSIRIPLTRPAQQRIANQKYGSGMSSAEG